MDGRALDLTADEREAVVYLLERTLTKMRDVQTKDGEQTRGPWSFYRLQAIYESAWRKLEPPSTGGNVGTPAVSSATTAANERFTPRTRRRVRQGSV